MEGKTVVVDCLICHHSLRLVVTMSLPKKRKKKNLGRLPLLPGSHLGRNFGPWGDFSP